MTENRGGVWRGPLVVGVIALAGVSLSLVLAHGVRQEAMENPFTNPFAIVAVGCLLTGIVCAYTHALLSRERRVRDLVDERTTALEENERRLRDMAEIASDWFWEMDAELRFTKISERYESAVGVPLEHFIGRTRFQVLGLDSKNLDEHWQEHLDDLENRRGFRNFRYAVTKRDGSLTWMSINGKPMFDDDGTFTGYWGSGRNVTKEETALRDLSDSERKMQSYIEELEISRQYLEENTREMAEMAERFAVEKERAELSERSKSEFLASMSHEIRTPMTGVMGFADLLLDGNLRDDEREKVLKIKDATQSLLTIINDILDLSKLEAGRLEIENLDFDLKEVIGEVMDLVADRARRKGLELATAFGNDVPEGMNADPTRMRQVLINLIGNAVKFTHEGGVTTRATKTEQGGRDFLRVEIVDTGIGISEANRQRLFQDFSQADASITRRYEGTGLGLAISRRLVELMGGEIGVDSTEGQGSTFWFTLPFRPARSGVNKKPRRALLQEFETKRPLNILIAEDNKLNQRIVAATLDKYGHAYVIVENGAQAVEVIDTEDFDLILMDVRMPEMSGPDATRAIRGRADKVADIPIIALTADAMQEHVRRYLDAGMNACVTKPIDRAMLLQTINEVLGESVHVPLTDNADEDDAGNVVVLENTVRNPDAERAAAAAVSDFLRGLENVAADVEQEAGSKSKS